MPWPIPDIEPCHCDLQCSTRYDGCSTGSVLSGGGFGGDTTKLPEWAWLVIAGFILALVYMLVGYIGDRIVDFCCPRKTDWADPGP